MVIRLHRNTLRAALIVLSAISFVMLSACALKAKNLAPAEDSQNQQLQQITEPTQDSGIVEYNGAQYRLREDLQTILLMGLDKYERPEKSFGYTNKLQSDFLLLLVLDESVNQVDVLHLNRDTMTQIRRLGIGGGEAGSFTGQLALAHTYGSGGSDSCLNAVKAVSTLLGGVNIDHYMTITMDAVGIINDAVGGVTLTVMDDFSDVDPSMQLGREVTLKGDQALTYVRARSGLEDSSNLARMERQRQYMDAFIKKLLACSKEQEHFLSQVLMKVNEDFVSDCTVPQLDALGNILESCTINPIQSLKGEAVLGEEFVEFYVDKASLRETVLALFYEKI